MDKPPRDREMPDGAKPGTAQPTSESDKYAYNADAKAAAREAAPITIGERVWRRVKKSWDVTRELRRLMREQERLTEKQLRLEAQKDAKTERIRGVRDFENGGWREYPITDESQIEEIEAEVATIDEEVDECAEGIDGAAYQMIRLLLRDPRSDEERAPEIQAAREALEVAKQSGDDLKIARAEYALEDAESGKPTDAFLKEHLDAAEAADLVRLLTAGREPDPTPATQSS